MEPVFSFDLVLPARGQGLRARSLHRQLRDAILDGRLAPGSVLPATRQVAAALAVARNTVAAAYELLIAEGYLTPRRCARPIVSAIAGRRAALSRPPRLRDTSRLNPVWRNARLAFTPSGNAPYYGFRLGVPDHRGFPHDVWRRLSGRVLRALSREPFKYPPTEGIPALREAIAHHVAFARAVACRAEDVIVTAGAQQAFDLIARALVTAGRTPVAVEEPGYPPLRAAFAAAGAKLLPVTVDERGLCVDRLPAGTKIVTVTPSHQSPTGVALSLERRTALLEFARRHDAVIVEDDYDGEFRFGGRPLDALQTLDRDGRVFYVGTFSKSLFPALRKGFIVAPAWARDALVAVKYCADSHSELFSQSVLAAFIREGHLARHVRRMHAVYAPRREALLASLRTGLDRWLEPIPSEAGLHLAARVRDAGRAPSVFALARRHLPGVVTSADYAMNPDCAPSLTFGYGVIDAPAIAPALRSLRRALEAAGEDDRS